MGRIYLKLTGIKSILLVFLFLGAMNSMYSQCPVIQFQDLRGTFGFPQFDNVSQCGSPDTLSILIFTDSPGEILGFDMEVKLVDGLQYGGFSYTEFGGNTSIAYAGGAPTDPEFSLSGITDPDDIMIANIAIGSNCDLDLASIYDVSIEYEYTYQDTMGNIFDCEGVFDFDQELNSALKRPELNMNTVSPLTRNLTSLATPYCQTMLVSQDGLQAGLEEMNFAICNFPTNDPSVSIVSVKANTIDLPFIVENDTVISTPVAGSYFLTNTSPNPTNEIFNIGEKISFEVCYQADFVLKLVYLTRYIKRA